MPSVTATELVKLQSNTKNIRNLCVLAHVDHGKTTLTDCLISTNGIISPKLVGRIRYMDNTKEEQQKGITMKASSISLLYKNEVKDQTVPDPDDPREETFLVNVIDSPGHVDFSGEVSTAVRITDGAIVVVDVVEGVCIQTQAVLRQAKSENVHPCLVLNKVDRLITELKLSPAEANEKLNNILQQINAIAGALWSERVMSEALEADSDWTIENADDSNVYFSPERGNVVFASAFDGWGFRIHHFANLLSPKLKIRRRYLLRSLWGEYYLNNKSKEISASDRSGKRVPMFVQFVLNNIWEVYTAAMDKKQKKLQNIVESLQLNVQAKDLGSSDYRVVIKAVMSAWLPVSTAVLGMVVEQLPSPKQAQRVRLPLLWDYLSAVELAKSKAEKKAYDRLVRSVLYCNPNSEDIVIYVSKVMTLDRSSALPTRAVPRATGNGNEAAVGPSGGAKRHPRVVTRRPVLRPKPAATEEAKTEEKETTTTVEEQIQTQAEEKGKEIADATQEAAAATLAATTEQSSKAVSQANGTGGEELELGTPSAERSGEVKTLVAETAKGKDKLFVAFARIFSGTIREGQKVHILGPRYDPSRPNMYHQVVELKELYMLMGKELERVTSVPAGNVFGIGGVEDIILKTATITTNPMCPTFFPMTFGFSPIVRVAVEPRNLSEMPLLAEGLRLLNQADPCVRVLVQQTGEHVIMAAGELHLERCLGDLRERFAKIDIEVSPPLVAFRETIISELAREAKTDLIEVDTPNKQATLKVRAVPLPSNIKAFLEDPDNQNSLRKIIFGHGASSAGESTTDTNGSTTATITTTTTATNGAEQSASSSSSDKKLGGETQKTRKAKKKEIKNEAEEKEAEDEGAAVSLQTEQQKQEAKDLQEETAFREKIAAAFTEAGGNWLRELQDNLWSLGPNGMGSNLLLNHIPGYADAPCWTPLSQRLGLRPAKASSEQGPSKAEGKARLLRELDNSLVSGFQLAAGTGPLCNEPMTGVAFILEDVDLMVSSQAEIEEHVYGPFSGQLISTMKDACREAFLAHSVRIVEPMYICDMMVNSAALGKTSKVLGKRRARIVDQDLRTGTDVFTIRAYLPVFESFGFAEELRTTTSGAANAQLVFSHWEVIDSDPFFVPTTQEEKEEFGESVESLPPPLSKRIITDVRKRKGLHVKEKIVERAEGQRNLSRKK